MVTFTKTNSYMSTLDQRLSTQPFENAVPSLTGEYNAAITSPLGQLVGQTLNGFMSVNQLQDYPGQLGNQLFGIGIAKLTEGVSGFAADLITEIEGAFSGLASGNANFTDVLTVLGTLGVLTGSSPAKGFLLSYYGASSANGMQGLLGSASSNPLAQIVSAISAVQSGSLQGFMTQAFNREISAIINPIIAEFNTKVDLTIGTAIKPVLHAIVDTIDTPIGFVIDDLTGGGLTDIARNNIITLISNGNYAAAIALTAASSNLPIGTIEDRIYGIDTKFTTRVTYTASTSLPTFEIGSNAVGWEGQFTPSNKYGSGTSGTGNSSIPYQFTTVAGTEELEADFVSATRDITEVVVHWTGTYIDQDIGAEDVHSWHQARGWSGCGYHYIIRRDGTIERGRPINYTGAHAKANGHNNQSIGVSFVGGYTVPSTGNGSNSPTGSSSFTAAQNVAFNRFMSTFYKAFPGGQAFGHMDTDPSQKIDPGFSVANYVFTNFGKKNVSSATSQPLTVAELQTYRASAIA